VLKRAFSRKPFQLSGYTRWEQVNINMKTVALWISEAAVISTIGYPKKHKTSSLKLHQWGHWKHRFDTFVIMIETAKAHRDVGLDK
jgi:hypothetical protein